MYIHRSLNTISIKTKNESYNRFFKIIYVNHFTYPKKTTLSLESTSFHILKKQIKMLSIILEEFFTFTVTKFKKKLSCSFVGIRPFINTKTRPQNSNHQTKPQLSCFYILSNHLCLY